MEIKITIETWNDLWRFEIEDKEFGEYVTSGERGTFAACVSECHAFVDENATQSETIKDKTMKTKTIFTILADMGMWFLMLLLLGFTCVLLYYSLLAG